MKNRFLEFTLYIKRKIRKFHVVVSRVTTAKKCTIKGEARAVLLFCFFTVFVAVVVG